MMGAATAGAQAGTTATAEGQQVTPGGENLELAVYFSLQDEAGAPLPETQIAEALVQLSDGTLTQAQIEQTPYYVALVLDASGSMAPVFDQVQQAALDLVALAPPSVYFAVIRFDEEIDLVQPFTNDHGQLETAVNSVTIDDDGTCLYDVAYTAVQTLEQVALNGPRRAMVVFTDGRDEIQRGVGDPCSQFTTEQVQAIAAEHNVPIHTVGIAGNRSTLNTTTLSRLSERTGGLSTAVSEEELALLLPQIINRINSQWAARAALKPGPGIQRGSLLLSLASGELLPPVPLLFTSDRDYRDPVAPTAVPQPPAIDITNFTYDEAADRFQFDINLSYLPPVSTLQVETVDGESNVQVNQTTLPNPASTQRITLGTVGMEPASPYLIRVQARDTGGVLVKDVAGVTVRATYPFLYEPPRPLSLAIDSIAIDDEPARLDLGSLRLEDDQPQLRVALLLANAGEVEQFTGRLVDLTGNHFTEEFTVDVTFTNAGATAVFPADLTTDGEYTLVINALAADGTRLATDNEKFTYTASDGILGRAGKALQSNPILLLFFMLLAVMVGFFGWRFGTAIGRRTAVSGPGLHLSGLPPQADEEDGKPQKVALTLVESPDPALRQIHRWQVDRLPFVIGREGADLSITGDQHVSRKHAKISYADGHYFIEDLGSSNGTFINATRIAAHEPLTLSEDRGERIRIGKTTTLLFSEFNADDENSDEHAA